MKTSIADCVASWSAVAAMARRARVGDAGTSWTIARRRYRRGFLATWRWHARPVTLRAPLGRWLAPFVAMAMGGAITVLGSFLPWVRTGSRTRNSYDVFRVVGRLGFAPDGPADTAMRWWPVVPLLAVAAVVAVWWGWARSGGALGIVAAVYGGVVGLAVATAPDAGLVDIGAGTIVTVVGAGVLLAGSVAAVAVRDEVSPTTDRGA
jgi:hypothetical protein